jgi:hypothetical protein
VTQKGCTLSLPLIEGFVIRALPIEVLFHPTISPNSNRTDEVYKDQVAETLDKRGTNVSRTYAVMRSCTGCPVQEQAREGEAQRVALHRQLRVVLLLIAVARH